MGNVLKCCDGEDFVRGSTDQTLNPDILPWLIRIAYCPLPAYHLPSFDSAPLENFNAPLGSFWAPIDKAQLLHEGNLRTGYLIQVQHHNENGEIVYRRGWLLGTHSSSPAGGNHYDVVPGLEIWDRYACSDPERAFRRSMTNQELHDLQRALERRDYYGTVGQWCACKREGERRSLARDELAAGAFAYM